MYICWILRQRLNTWNLQKSCGKRSALQELVTTCPARQASDSSRVHQHTTKLPGPWWLEDGKPVLDPMLVLWTVEWWTRDSVLDIIRPVLDAVCSKDLQNSKLQATTSQRTCLTCSLFCAVVSMNTQSGHFEDWCAPAESTCKLRLMNDIIMTIESWQTWYIIYLYVFLFTHAHPSTDRNSYDTRSLGHVSHQDVFWLSLPASQQGAQPHHNTNRSTKTVYEFLVFYQR